MEIRRLFSLSEWRLFYEKHERQISSGALLLGFVVDSLTLQRIDLLFENVVLFSYITVAGLTIALINLYEGGRIKWAFVGKIHPFLPLVMQFSFGALFSGFVVFYMRSATLSASWPFLLMLLGILVGNEFFRRRYTRLSFQITLFFLALFSFLIFYVPIIVGQIGVWVFLLSGILGLFIMAVLLYWLYKAVPLRIQASKKMIWAGIGSVFLVMNLLYVTNVIPPIPLSLKDAGVYYNITRLGGGDYRLLDAKKRWYEYLRPYEIFYMSGSEPVYAWSAVFAPTDLNTDIVHHWQYFDGQNLKWITSSKVTFPIVGGRDEGFRGYSIMREGRPGFWRVDIETPGGQRIGRVKFKIIEDEGKPELVTETK